MSQSEIFLKGNKAYINGDYQVAIKLFNQELAIDSRNELAYLGKAKALIKTGKVKEGIETFEPCLALLEPSQTETYLDGFRSFLLKNNLTDEAVRLLFNHVKLLNLKKRVDLLLGFALQNDQNYAVEFIGLNSAKANVAIIYHIGANDAISDMIKMRCDAFYNQFVLKEKRLLLQRFADNQTFINQLDSKYNALQADYQTHINELTYIATDMDMALYTVYNAHKFINEDLHDLLKKVEHDDLDEQIRFLIEENRVNVDLFKAKTTFLKKALELAQKERIREISSINESQDLFTSINEVIGVLRGKNMQQITETLSTLPQTTQKIQSCTDSIEIALIKKYDHLVGQKKYNKARKIGQFLYKNLNQNAHYLTAHSKFIKKIRATIIVTVCVLLTIIFGSIFAYNYYQQNKYAEAEEVAFTQAINAATHSQYSKYLRLYPNTENANKIRELDEEYLYKKALNGTSISDFNLLSENYPNSAHLVIIRFEGEALNAYNILETVHGEELSSEINQSYKVPIGMRLKYTIEKPDKLTKTKYFTAVENLSITPTLTPYKTLVFEDDFQTNENAWRLQENIKQDFFSERVKSIKIENGSLIFKHDQRGNELLLDMISTPISNKKDFEIEISIQQAQYDNGYYVLFGASSRAFNYLQIAGNDYNIGHNNLDNSDDRWTSYTNGRMRNSAINRGGQNVIRIIKTNDLLTFMINGTYLNAFELKKWYGNRIGFGVPYGATAIINNLKIYELSTIEPPLYSKNQVYFCNVENLNLRSSGDKNSEIITALTAGTPVKYLGEKSREMSKTNLYGQDITDHYYKFELLDGTQGWLHGGALCDLDTKHKIPFDIYRKQLKQ